MLKGIPAILTLDLLKILIEMGHGNEIVIADGNFPAAALAKRLVRLDGNGIPELLDAVLKFFPLDFYVKNPAGLMAVDKKNMGEPPIWQDYRKIIKQYEPDFDDFALVERFAFYERSKNSFAIISTGEKALYANIILKKGII